MTGREHLKLLSSQEQGEDIQSRLQLLFSQSYPPEQEVLISVNRINMNRESSLVPCPIPTIADSRIQCDQLLLGRKPTNPQKTTPDNLSHFYFPVFSTDRQARTFSMLLTLVSEGHSEVVVPVLEPQKRLHQKLLGRFRLTTRTTGESMITELLSWTRLAQKSGITISVFKHQGKIRVPDQAWIVSDPMNQGQLYSALLEDLEWYRVTVIRKRTEETQASEEFPSKPFEIAG